MRREGPIADQRFQRFFSRFAHALTDSRNRTRKKVFRLEKRKKYIHFTQIKVGTVFEETRQNSRSRTKLGIHVGTPDGC